MRVPPAFQPLLALLWAAASVFFFVEGRWLVSLAIAVAGIAAYLAARIPKKKYAMFAIVAIMLWFMP